MTNILKDYTSKLNDHQNYLKILDKLERKCDYIEIVIIAEGEIFSNNIVSDFKDDILDIRVVSKWYGTESSCENKLVKIKSSKKLFQYLSNFETFCKYYFCKIYNEEFKSYVDVQENTDFGYDDIAFFDINDNVLLYTTTHECYITINENLIQNDCEVF